MLNVKHARAFMMCAHVCRFLLVAYACLPFVAMELPNWMDEYNGQERYDLTTPCIDTHRIFQCSPSKRHKPFGSDMWFQG